MRSRKIMIALTVRLGEFTKILKRNKSNENISSKKHFNNRNVNKLLNSNLSRVEGMNVGILTFDANSSRIIIMQTY